jgi:DNA-binding transcriptional MerR regulator
MAFVEVDVQQRSRQRPASWSIAQVARMSKVTSRTLRHYDAIGLLRPARVASNGYRHYERDQLVRLQQILLLRDLGLGLEAIGKILAGEHDPVAALRRHHRWLLEERERLGRLARTVRKTIEELEELGEGDPVQPEQWFEGFDADKQARYEAELVERYGEGMTEHIAASKERMKSWTKPDVEAIRRDWTEFSERIAALAGAGVPADDPQVLDALDIHRAWLSRFWTPNSQSYAGLGELYADHPDFRQRFEALQPGLADFLREAMAVYAQARL